MEIVWVKSHGAEEGGRWVDGKGEETGGEDSTPERWVTARRRDEDVELMAMLTVVAKCQLVDVDVNEEGGEARGDEVRDVMVKARREPC